MNVVELILILTFSFMQGHNVVASMTTVNMTTTAEPTTTPQPPATHYILGAGIADITGPAADINMVTIQVFLLSYLS